MKKARQGGWRPVCPWWRWALVLLSALALALSADLGWHDLVGGPVTGCGEGSACDQVLNSRWSSIGGWLPVSGLAAGAYLAMLVASLFIGPTTEAPVRRLAWRTLLVLTGAAAGSAVWFIIVQQWIIRAFCPYCLATHFTGLLLAALVLWRAPRQPDPELLPSPQRSAPVPGRSQPGGCYHDQVFQGLLTFLRCCARGRAHSAFVAHPTVSSVITPVPEVPPAALRRVIGRWPAVGFAAVGVVLAGLLAACQVYFVPPAVNRAGESKDNLPVIDTHNAPLIGSPDAPYVVKLLFDFNCPHCQELNMMLDEAVRRYGGKLAFVLCPTPLNTKCNPYIPRDVDEFKDSCELARVGLAVWVARREAFPAFDRWMFSFESGDHWQPRSLAAARAKAIELVGQARFDAAQADPWISQYLQTSIQIYGHTARSGNHAIPKLVLGSRWVAPQPNDANDLVLILHDRLDLPKP
jgi:uncharacterized membrane protein